MTYEEGEGLLELGDLLFSKCLSLKSDRDMLAQKKKKNVLKVLSVFFFSSPKVTTTTTAYCSPPLGPLSKIAGLAQSRKQAAGVRRDARNTKGGEEGDCVDGP